MDDDDDDDDVTVPTDKTLDWLHLYLFCCCVPICWRILNCWLPAPVCPLSSIFWVDCALVINLVYWKASVREMMCVNCMNFPYSPFRIRVSFWALQLWIWVECWMLSVELSWQRLCKWLKNCINSCGMPPTQPHNTHRERDPWSVTRNLRSYSCLKSLWQNFNYFS